MIKNHLKTGVRHLIKNKIFSLINIVGLTLGTICCLYILLYVKDQYSYEKHLPDVKDIYRLITTLKLPGDQTDKLATVSPPIAPALKNDFPEIKAFARVVSLPSTSKDLLTWKDRSFFVNDAVYADDGFFEIFAYHFIHGDPNAALKKPNSIVLLDATSEKLFGKNDPVGEVISIDNTDGKENFTVTGVVDKSLGRSNISANFFISMSSGGLGKYVMTNDSWAGNNFVTAFVKLNPNTSPRSLESKFPQFLQKYGATQLKASGMQKTLNLQALTQIHTTPGLDGESFKTVNPIFLKMLLFIAAMIQLIACINFMNLSTARSVHRAREVGVRKVIGAVRGDLILQFLIESFLISGIAVGLAIPLLKFALPSLNYIADADISFSLISQYDILILLVLMVIGTGAVAGSYPAFYLSGFKILKVIKGDITNKNSAINLRKSMVVFQFTLSVVLIIGVLVINRQIKYINDKDLGFDKSQKLIITFQTADAQKKMDAFKTELDQLASIRSVSFANNYPGQFIFNDQPLFLANGDMAHSKDIPLVMTKEGYIKTMGIHLLQGRDFERSDSGKVILNQAAMNFLGISSETAIGTRLYSERGDTHARLNFQIVGIMKDLNFNSLHEEIKPLMFIYHDDESDLANMIISAETKDYGRLLSQMEVKWKKLIPGVPFEYSFLDEAIQHQYNTEVSLSRMIDSFTLIAIFISCLGLFGLSAFIAEQRRKEIGIRKVLGASVPQLTGLLSKDFLKLVLIASIIAFPLAWWLMSRWLENYQYHIELSWIIFLLAASIAMVIALITVGSQAIKASVANPIKSLRTE